MTNPLTLRVRGFFHVPTLDNPMLIRKSTSTTYPVTLEQLKAHLGYSGTDHDARLTRVLKSATQYLEREANCSIRDTTWELCLPRYEYCIRIPKHVKTIESVKAWVAGEQQTIDEENYHPLIGDHAAILWFDKNFSINPDCRPDAITIEFVAGQNTELVQDCILLIAGWFDQDREANRDEKDGVSRIVNILRSEFYS